MRRLDESTRAGAERHDRLARGAAALVTHLADLPAGGRHWRAEVLAEVPGRRLVARYDFLDPSGAAPPQQVVGKFYADDTGRRVAVVMGRLAGAPTRAPLRVPRPLCYDADNRMLGQEFASGTPLWERIGTPAGIPALHRVGMALAALHAAPLDARAAGPQRTVADHLVELIQPHPMVLARRLPHHRRAIEALIDGLLNLDSGRARAPSPVHRDFHLGQLVDDGLAVWVLDHDLLALGDGALDLGNFTTHLQTRLPPATAQECLAAFVTGYRVAGGRIEPWRLALFSGLTHLRLAAKAYRLRRPGLIADRLADGAAALERARHGQG